MKVVVEGGGDRQGKLVLSEVWRGRQWLVEATPEEVEKWGGECLWERK